MRALVWLVLCLLLPAACPARPSPPATEPAAFPAAGELVWDGAQLSYANSPTAKPRPLAGVSPLPYQTVCLGPPALVTVLDSALVPTTWAAADSPHQYVDMLPALVKPPLCALTQFPAAEMPGLPGMLLLKPDGSVAWQGESSELMWPAAAEESYFSQPAVAYIVAAEGGDLIYPYGSTPQLVAVNTADGSELWRADLKAPAAAAGVTLLALSPQWGLLCLQYDYQVYEFVRFSCADGTVGPRWPLPGQVATRIVYPGQLDEPLSAQLTGDRLELTVIVDNQGYAVWSFDLATGELSKQAASAPASIRREENQLPVGGEGVPGPPAPPFPQRLLPSAVADQPWRIPALLNAAGDVLVIDADGARWAELGQQ